MEEVTIEMVHRWIGILLILHAVGSQLAGIVWQAYTDHKIDELDLKAIRVLWFIFLPLGLGVVLFGWLDTTFPQHAPIRRRDDIR